jgi:hypothetical protein
MPDYRRHRANSLLELIGTNFDRGANLVKGIQDSQQRRDLQTQSEQAALAKQSAEQSGALANAKALKDHEATVAATKRKQAQTDNLAMIEQIRSGLAKQAPGRRYSINASDDGGLSVTEQENLGQIQANIARQERAQKEKDQALVKFGERIEDKKIPETVSQLKGALDAMPKEGEEFKSVGPWLNAVPDMLVPALEYTNVLPEGSQKERAGFNTLKLLTGHPLFGSSFTPGEAQQRERSFGLPIGGSEQDARDSMKRMADIPIETMSNIEKSSRPDVVQEYGSRGGMSQQGLESLLRGKVTPQVPGVPGDGNANAGQTQQKTEVRRQRNKKTGQVRITYSDGSTSIE